MINTKLIILIILTFLSSCISRSERQKISDISELNAMTKANSLSPLALKIRQKALQLRTAQQNPLGFKNFGNDKSGDLPTYVKEIILAEVTSQKFEPSAPTIRPCFVAPTLKQPRDIFYALQRAAFGLAKPSSTQNPDPDQGVGLSPFWNGVPWAKIVGYELGTYKLLDQIELWMSQLNPSTFDAMAQASLGLTQVRIPEKFKNFVRRNIVINDLDLVVNNRGRDRQNIRCFLAHQLTSLRAIDPSPQFQISESHQWLIALNREFNIFENFKTTDFGVLKSEDDLNKVNDLLSIYKQIDGLSFNLRWWDRDYVGLTFDTLLETKLDKTNRDRIKNFHGKFGYLKFLPHDYIFRIFPNMTHFSLDLETSADLNAVDYRLLADILIEANIKKVKNLELLGFESEKILTLIRDPLDSVENLEIRSNRDTMDLAEVARVFPKAKRVVVLDSYLRLNTENLKKIHERGVKVTWKKLFLQKCWRKWNEQEKLNFVNPVFSDPNFKVTTLLCEGGLTIEQAPTMDDIIQSLAHRLHYDQQSSKCVP